jgi:hypothetical protein
MIEQALHRKLKNVQHEPTNTQDWTDVLRMGKQFPAPLMASVVLRLLITVIGQDRGKKDVWLR